MQTVFVQLSMENNIALALYMIKSTVEGRSTSICCQKHKYVVDLSGDA